MILKLSWRNVWRNKLRSLVIIIAVAFGIAAAVFAGALTNGLIDQKMRIAIESQTAHIQMHNSAFQENMDIRHSLPDADFFSEQFAGRDDIKSWSGRIVSTAMLNTANGTTGMKLLGIEPEIEKKVSAVSEMIIDGAYFEGARRNPIVISQRAATKLQVRLRSKIVITMQDIDGEIVGAAFRVVGIFKTPSAMFDEGHAFVKQSDMAKLLNSDKIHEVAILLKDIDRVPETVAELRESAPENVEVLAFTEVLPELAAINDSGWISNLILLIIILLALAFGIINTMLMAIFERIREIGVLMAVGMQKLRVFSMITIETIFLAMIGGVIGMIIGDIILRIVSRNGIDLSAFAEGMAEFGVETIVYPSIDTKFYLLVTLMVVLTAIFSSMFPAIKALRLKPNEAVRHK